MKYKLFAISFMMFIGVFSSSIAFSRVAMDSISYDIASWPVFVGDWCEFYTTVVANPKVENLLVVGRVDGVEVYRETFPIVSTEISPRVSFKWQPLKAGSHEIAFMADPDGRLGAPFTQKMIMPVKPADLAAKEVVLLRGIAREGEIVTTAGSFQNKNDIRINETFFVQFMDKATILKRFEVHGIGPKEVMSFNVNVNCHHKYHDITIIVDSSNVIAEANETNNRQTLFLHCLQPGDPGF